MNANGFSFVHPQSVIDGVYTPDIVPGYADESSLGMNANGSSFTQLQSITDGAFAPTIVTGYGNVSCLGSGSSFMQSQFNPNGVFAPAVSTLSATTHDQGIFNEGAFADFNDDFNAHGLNHGNNPLPTLNAHSFNYDSNAFLNMNEYSYNYGNNSLLSENNTWLCLRRSAPDCSQCNHPY